MPASANPLMGAGRSGLQALPSMNLETVPQGKIQQGFPEFFSQPGLPADPFPGDPFPYAPAGVVLPRDPLPGDPFPGTPIGSVPESITPPPSIPVETPPGAPLGSPVTSYPTGVLTGLGAGVASGILGIMAGESPDVAIAQGIGGLVGASLGGSVGAAIGAPLGPAGALIAGGAGQAIGATIGGLLAGQLAQGIHNFFFPPSIHQGPNDMVPLPHLPQIGHSGERYDVYVTTKGYRIDSFFGTRTPIDYEASPLIGNPYPGPISGVGFSPSTGTQQSGVGTGANYIVAGSPAQKYTTGFFDFGPHINVYESETVARVVRIGGGEEPFTPLLPGDFQQSGQPYPRLGGVPLFVTIPPLPKPSLPDTLPQTAPVPTVGPKQEKKPGIGIFLDPPKYNPPGTEPDSTPTTTPSPNDLPNLNNIPGLFGLPFIPAVMPANKPSPSGSLQIDPGSGGTGTGKPPKAPTNSPCSGACQRAIEGRIQGVDDKLTKALQQGQGLGQDAALAEILRRLAVLDAKVGAQIPTGISGFISRFREAFDKLADWLHLDRLLNIMTFIVTLQNAYFLTDSLKIVTLQMISDGLNVLGFKDKDGNGLNLNKLLDSTIENMLKKVLGVDTLEGMKKEWKALSRIYQAGSNIIYAFQNIAWSIINALDIIGSWNAQIGNALKKYGVVGRNAFNWFNPAPNFHNKFFTAVNNALNIVSNIDFVAQSIIQGRQAVDEITKQSEEFSKDFTELTNPKPPEHKPTADAASKTATDSHSSPPTQDDINHII